MKEIIRSDSAPAAIGPYSQAVKVQARSLVFCSGQISMDPASGEIVGKTASEQCRQVMENLQAVLKASGGDFSHVVKTTVYLADMEDFASVNDVYASYFDADPPARAAVQVGRLPRDVRVEVDAIAVV